MKSITNCICLVLSCGVACAASAQSTWSGGAGTSDWLTPSNWAPFGVPGINGNINFNVTINPSAGTTVQIVDSPNPVTIMQLNIPSTFVNLNLIDTQMDVRGDYFNAGSMLVDAGSFMSRVRFYGSSISGGGHGNIRLDSGPSNAGRAYLFFGANPTIAAGMVIHGRGTTSGGCINNGLILADVFGQNFYMYSDGTSSSAPLTNHGTISATGGGNMFLETLEIDNTGGTFLADGGTIRFEGGIDISGGTLSTANGGTIIMNATGSVYESGVHFAGNILTTETGILRFNFNNLHPMINNSGVIHATKVTGNGAPAFMNLRYSSTFTGGGVLSMEARTGQVQEVQFTEQGGTQLINGAGHTIRGIGTFNVAVLNQGVIKVGFDGDAPNNDQITALEFNRALTLGTGGRVEIALDGQEAGTPASGHLNALMPLAMAGTLRVLSEGNLAVTNVGRTWDLISSPGLSGSFSTIQLPALPRGLRWITSVARFDNLDHFRISISCAADFNGDDTVDFFDYLDFVNAFAANQPHADFNGDAIVDFFDYLDFVDAFSTGC